MIFLISLLFVPLFYFRTIKIYRNGGARHHYEYETMSTIKNVKFLDSYARDRIKIQNRWIESENSDILNNWDYLDKTYMLFDKK